MDMQNPPPNSAGRRVFVGAFGKHPGWNDHMDDIGLETDRLVAFKRQLYIEGVAGNIESGAWERLAPDQRLAGFGSVFLSLADGAPLLGRMWASQDGKGRGRYPMVVCVQTPGQSLAWMLEQAAPSLEQTEGACRAAKTADAVRTILAGLRSELAARLPAPADGTRPPPLPPDGPAHPLAGLVQALEAMQDGSGFRRVLYKIERDMPTFLQTAGRDPLPPARHVRTPSVTGSPAQDLTAWAAALAALLDPALPLFLNRPVREPWVDILAGVPQGQHFYCLLASRQAIPLASDVPYNMDPAFVERANALAASWRGGSLDVQELLTRANGMGAGRTGGWLGRLRGLFRG